MAKPQSSILYVHYNSKIILFDIFCYCVITGNPNISIIFLHFNLGYIMATFLREDNPDLLFEFQDLRLS